MLPRHIASGGYDRGHEDATTLVVIRQCSVRVPALTVSLTPLLCHLPILLFSLDGEESS
jgi:hypothetical protein